MVKIKKYIKDKYGLNFSSWIICGVRGHDFINGNLVPNSDEIDFYNDTLFILKDKDFKVYRCTMDPGLHWIMKPMSVLGAARIEEGLYTYQRGKHKGHDAFTQASKVTVRRDKNKDKQWTEEQTSGFFGINIHPRFTVSNRVGINSAGCTVIDSLPDQKDWKDFQSTLYASVQKIYPYVVMNKETYEAL